MEGAVAIILRAIFILSVFVAPVLAQAPSSQQEQPEFIKQGQQLMREGKLDDALALYRQTLQTSPDSLPANIAAGSVLDLLGQGEEARRYFGKAIQVADTPEHKAMAQRAMAMSYASEGNCKKTIQHEQLVFNYYGSVKDFFRQGETADEAARVCIDSDDLDSAYEWYKTGYETGLKESDIKPGRKSFGSFVGSMRKPAWPRDAGTKPKRRSMVLPQRPFLTRETIPSSSRSSRTWKATSHFMQATTRRLSKIF